MLKGSIRCYRSGIDFVKGLIRNIVACCEQSGGSSAGFAAVVSLLLLLLTCNQRLLIKLLGPIADADAPAVAADRCTAVVDVTDPEL